jgi:hypothetical protein
MHEPAHVVGDAFDRVHALGDRHRKLAAFAFARRDELLEHLVQQGERGGVEGLGIERAGLQHAGILQQVGELHPQLRKAHAQALCQHAQALDRRFVQLQQLDALACAQTQHQVDLAAREPRGDALAQRRFQDAQLLRQAHAHFEEAMIDRAQLAGQHPAFGAAFAGGEGGHAANHAVVGVLAGRQYAIGGCGLPDARRRGPGAAADRRQSLPMKREKSAGDEPRC